MQTMQKRNRVTAGKEKGELDEYRPVEPRKRPVTQSSPHMPITHLTDREKEQLIMQNLLINKPRLVESAPACKRGSKLTKHELIRVNWGQ